MFQFDRPVWALLNTRTGKLFTPLKIGRCTFRGVYDSLRAAKAGARVLNKTVAELDDGTLPRDKVNKFYGFDVEAIKGWYEPVEIASVQTIEVCLYD